MRAVVSHRAVSTTPAHAPEAQVHVRCRPESAETPQAGQEAVARRRGVTRAADGHRVPASADAATTPPGRVIDGTGRP